MSRITKRSMYELLAEQRALTYPDIYRGHKYDAFYFVQRQYPTWDEAYLACINARLLKGYEPACGRCLARTERECTCLVPADNE